MTFHDTGRLWPVCLQPRVLPSRNPVCQLWLRGTGVAQVSDSIYAFTHFEGPLPSQLYHMELKQDKLGGLTVVRQQV